MLDVRRSFQSVLIDSQEKNMALLFMVSQRFDDPLFHIKEPMNNFISAYAKITLSPEPMPILFKVKILGIHSQI